MDSVNPGTATERTTERRREVRLSCTYTVARARVDSFDEPVAAHIIEISKTGLRIRSDEPIPVGTLATIDMGQTTVLAEVRHCEARPDQSYTVGFLMHEVSDQPLG